MIRMYPSVLDNIQQLRCFFLGTAQKPDSALIHLPRYDRMNDRKAAAYGLIKKETKLTIQRPHIIIANKKSCTHSVI